jgi:hypothetical protein
MVIGYRRGPSQPGARGTFDYQSENDNIVIIASGSFQVWGVCWGRKLGKGLGKLFGPAREAFALGRRVRC